MAREKKQVDNAIYLLKQLVEARRIELRSTKAP